MAGPSLPAAHRSPSRRVSYVVPFPAGPPPPRLAVPALGAAREPWRRCDPRPLIIYEQAGGPTSPTTASSPSLPPDDGHPRHCLGVNALALDLSTVLAGPSSRDEGSSKRKRTPEGILYTGGRDGLVAAWELGLPTRRRKRRYGDYGRSKEGRARAGMLSDPWGGDDDFDDEDGSDEVGSSEGENDYTSVPRRRQHPPERRTSSGLDDGSGADPPFEEQWEVNYDRLSTPGPRSSFRQCVQSHTDWCNDIVLCNYNQTVVSASADRTLKAWNPHSADRSMSPETIGTHMDYVRCLAHSRDAGWVASGGLDRRIKLWDVGQGRKTPLVEFPEGSAKASIYSLATNQSGTILAMGSPERVLRLYDPRSAAKLCKLVGHTDNVRALLLSDDGRFLLSASSDATVKLWSLGMQRCLHTFSYPSAGVWSLWSQHPSLEIFYSGDRAGYVCKVDLESCGDPSEGECAVLCKVEDGDPVGDHGERAGDQAINRIVGADDTFIWTATGSSNVQRWRDVRPRWERMTPFDLPSNGDVDGELTSSLQSGISPATLRNLSPPGLAHRSSSPGSGSPPLGPADRSALGFGMQQAGAPLTRTVSGASVAFADHATVHPFRPGAIPIPYSPTRTSSGAAPIPPRRPQSTYSTTGPSRPMSDEKDGLPLESLVPLEDPNDVVGKGIFAFGQHRDPESGTLYSSTSIHSAHSLVRATSIVSAQSPLNQVFGASFRGVQGVHRPSSTHTVDLSTPKRPLSPGADGGPSTSSQAWQLYQFRDTASEASPYRDEPDEVLYGRAGLLRCEMLNDRRHVVSIDTTGELALWDVIQGLCVGIFGTSRSVRERRPSGASSAASSTSSASSSRAVLDWLKDRLEGFAAVSAWCTVETHTGRLKVHLEEGRCFDGEVYADEADLDAALLDEMREDHRIAYGRWILRNLFEGFVYQQLHQRHLEVQQSETAPVPRPRTESIEPSVRFSRTHPPTLSGVAGPLNRQPFRRLSSALPHTPGMTIALATPAATPALPPDLPHGRTFDLTPIAGSPPNTTSNAHTPFAGPRHPPADYFSVRANNGTSPTVKAGNSETSSSYADLASTQSPITPTAENASAGFLSRFKSFGRPKRGADKTQDTDIPSAPPTPAAVDVAESAADHPLAHLSPEQRLQRETVDAILARPIQPCGPIDAPPLSLPPDMPILISEESHDSGAWEVTYRGLVRTTEDDMSMLEATMPAWLLELLLGNRTVVKEAPKVAFMLEPQDGMEKAGMQELPNSNARLTASRILRMRKVAVYVSQKLELDHDNNGAPQAKRRASDSLHSRAPSSSSLAALGGKSPLPAAASTNGTSTPNSSLAATSTSPVTTNGAHRRAEDEIELLCNGQLVPWTMSLGAVKQFVWAKAGDVLIGYRAKAVPVTVASPV